MASMNYLFIALVLISLLSHITNQQDDYEDEEDTNSYGSGSAKASGSSEKAESVPGLKPEQIEFSKRWWKQLGQQQGQLTGGQGGGQSGQKIKKKKRPQTYARAAQNERPTPEYDRGVRPSGDWQFLDSIVATLFPLGDPYTGVPDGIFDLARYCIDFIIQGVIFIAYSTIRWPHKILLKTMLALGAVSHLATNSIFCLTPLSMTYFVQKSKIVNSKMDELTENTRIWKKRLANSIDKFPQMSNIQKHSCCAYWDWKRKSVQIVPKDAKNFVFMWFTGFYKIHEVVYCQMLSMKQFEQWCVDYEFMDMEPIRVLPRSFITLCVELFTKFF